MANKFWRPVEIGNNWYIALLPENASITTPITKDIKKMRVGRVSGEHKGVNYYAKAWDIANTRNRRIDPSYKER